MTLTLTDDLEELINAAIESGAFQTPDEVLRASLRLLEAQNQGRETLRREVMRAVDDIQQGRFHILETDEDLGAFSDKISRAAITWPGAT